MYWVRHLITLELKCSLSLSDPKTRDFTFVPNSVSFPTSPVAANLLRRWATSDSFPSFPTAGVLFFLWTHEAKYKMRAGVPGRSEWLAVRDKTQAWMLEAALLPGSFDQRDNHSHFQLIALLTNWSFFLFHYNLRKTSFVYPTTKGDRGRKTEKWIRLIFSIWICGPISRLMVWVRSGI